MDKVRPLSRVYYKCGNYVLFGQKYRLRILTGTVKSD